MTTVVIQGLTSRRLITQGYRAAPRPPSLREPTLFMLRLDRDVLDIRHDRPTITVAYHRTPIHAR
jgi:hypothetical protein